jgi:hypothetical protein
LKADDGGPCWAGGDIVRAAGTRLSTVHRARQELVESGLEAALYRRKPIGRQCRKPDGAQEAQWIARACSAAPEGRARWTPALLAQRLKEARRLEVHFTPKHGSWLDMAEIELSALAMRDQGVDAGATPRASRGIVKKPESQGMRHIERGDKTHKPRESKVKALKAPRPTQRRKIGSLPSGRVFLRGARARHP